MASKKKTLRRARKSRSQMSTEYGLLRDGDITLSELLQDPSGYSLARCTIWDVLRRSPKLGPKGAKRVLLESKVWPLDRLEDIDQFARETILSNLPARAR
jgi:hypothetical protein